jgi:trehalose-phosphatase
MSGRPLNDLVNRARLGDDVFYIGLHGLEIGGPGFTRAQHGVIDAYRDRLLEIVEGLRITLAGIPGVRLEFKRAVIAVHTRGAGPEDAVWSRFQLLNAVSRLLDSGAVRVIRGHDVLEVLPNVGALRAEAIAAVRQVVEQRRHAPAFTVYIGEDSPDDDGFDAVGARGVGAVVGMRGPRADFHLTRTEVDRFIEEVAAGRQRRSAAPRRPRLRAG